MSGIWLPDCSILAINWKNDNNVTIFWHDVIITFCWCCFVSLMKFSYWSKFHVNIITDSRVMIISFYKGLTRNLEIGNTPVWVLPNIWRLGQVGDTKFGANVSNKMLLHAAKYQGHSFYRFWVIKGKPKVGSKITPSATQIRVKTFIFSCMTSCKLKVCDLLQLTVDLTAIWTPENKKTYNIFYLLLDFPTCQLCASIKGTVQPDITCF